MDENKTAVPAATASTEAVPLILTQDELDAKVTQFQWLFYS